MRIFTPENHIKAMSILFLVAFIAIFLLWTPNITATSTSPLVLGAHRGDSVKYTENSIEAIKHALEDDKYKFIEIDIQYTKDKKIVLSHDYTLLRLQGKTTKISSITYEELEKISEYHMPLFDEAIDLIDNQKNINIEIKTSSDIDDNKEIVDYVINYCREKGILDNIIISSVSAELIEYISLYYPEIKTGIIYWIHPITYIPSKELVKHFYNKTEEIGADYIMLHGVNIKNNGLLTKYKPDNQTLVFWYFDNRMYVVEEDPTEILW